ncbi:MAG TPA: ATP-dependent metallopeptidase FtsH/Yme1/Tma family protein [Bryobacteraceae bacterium]|nr:ATP-dependent metallopeptidase FtsH/Yme1/Tma family protein [Bryobacteraceae bacterium]
MSELMKVSPKRIVQILLAAIAGWFAFSRVPKPPPELTRMELLEEVREGHVKKVVIEDEEVILGESTTRGSFRTAFKKSDTALVTELRALGVEVQFEKSAPGLI